MSTMMMSVYKHVLQGRDQYKRIICFLIPVLLAVPVFSQYTAGDIDKIFEKTVDTSLREKIFIHTDKDFYVAGEIAWLKLYVVDGSDNRPLSLSRLAYVEILDDKGAPVIQQKISLKEGKGNGSVFLPSSLSSGVYRVRGYTRWMKNFGEDGFFEKTVTIVNTLKESDELTAIHDAYAVSFFPEGGDLVQGLENNVAFRITDQFGRGQTGSGFVIRNNTDTLTRFHTLRFGMGHFLFTPLPGDTYKAVIQLADTILIKPLPAVQEAGYVLSVREMNESRLSAAVKTNISGKDFVYVLVHTNQHIEISEKISFRDGMAELAIDKSKLKEGVSAITVFDDKLVPVCERLYFKKPVTGINVQVNSDKTSYDPRKKVQLSLHATDENGKPSRANLSAAVYKLDSFSKKQQETLEAYLWLSSELKGEIESPGYYFTASGEEAEQVTDDLMLTQGWRRFKSKDRKETRTNQPAYSFIPEYRGDVIDVKITDKATGGPIKDELMYLSVPGLTVRLFCSKTDSNGVARFFTKGINGSNELVIQADRHPASTCNIEILDPFYPAVAKEGNDRFEPDTRLEGVLTDYSTSMQVQNYYYSDKLKQYNIPAADSVAFYGKPDAIYKLDDYTRFSTMEEVLREYVLEVLVRRRKENFRLIMSEGNDDRLFFDDPFLLLNSVPVLDPDKVMQYDPLKVRTIDLIKTRYVYGPVQMNGIVNFTTYQPDPAVIAELGGAVLEYEGAQYEREFYSPVYETEEAVSGRLPDFRTLLYWSPDILTNSSGDASLSFYTSDLKGKYLVVVQGITDDGKAGDQMMTIDVK